MKQICTRCVYDVDTPAITFDENGVCSYCTQHDQLCEQYPAGDAGQKRLEQIAEKIKRDGHGRKYDCVVGVSGGCDSSYLLHLACELGLRPLAVHFDNTWNSTIATENIEAMVDALGVDLYTHVVDNRVYNDVVRAFLRAGVPDIETPTDIALAATMYRACVQHGVRYQLSGHNFRTEGVAPLGWFYMDGRYIESVVKAHGDYAGHRLRSFPNMKLPDMLHWMVLRRIKQIRPLWHIDLDKTEVKSMLTARYGWQWYGGHHLENRLTAFLHTYVLPRRFGIDGRKLGHAAMCRTGYLNRSSALLDLAKSPVVESSLVELVCKRLSMKPGDLYALMAQPRKTYRDYPNYKRTFERLRPLFWLLSRADLVPRSFYLKYTRPDPR